MLKTEAELLERLRTGRLIEGLDTATEAYVEGLKRTLIVSADTELISAPAYLRAARDAPSINSYMSAVSIIQDELGHAHIAYRMLRDLGVDTDQLVYEREPKAFKYPYAFDVPLDRWEELVVANAFYDRAGFVLLSDIYQNTSYGPWKRALVKVDREETFHLRHGERWMKILADDPDRKAAVQRAVDWMFVLTLEWFGLPDDLEAPQGAGRLPAQGPDQRPAAPDMDVGHGAAVRAAGFPGPRPPGPGKRPVPDRLSLPDALRRGRQALGPRGGRHLLGRRAGALAAARAVQRGVRRHAPAWASPAAAGPCVTMVSVDDVRAALAEVIDPELPVSIVDLGLVRSIAVHGATASVGITFTSIACPCTDVLREDVEARLRRLDGVAHVEVEEVFEPWSREDMTEDGRLALLALGVT